MHSNSIRSQHFCDISVKLMGIINVFRKHLAEHEIILALSRRKAWRSNVCHYFVIVIRRFLKFTLRNVQYRVVQFVLKNKFMLKHRVGTTSNITNPSGTTRLDDPLEEWYIASPSVFGRKIEHL